MNKSSLGWERGIPGRENRMRKEGNRERGEFVQEQGVPFLNPVLQYWGLGGD